MPDKVVPDKDSFGPEYALAFMIADFETKLPSQWENDYTNNKTLSRKH
jgi:hypothetical protein